MKKMFLILFILISLTTKSTTCIQDTTQKNVAFNTLSNQKKVILEFENANEFKLWLSESQEEGVVAKLLPLLLTLLTILGSVLIWYLNEKSKRELNIQKQKEERYKKMVICIKAFTTGSPDVTLRQEFIDQLNLSWVYCPDEVVKKGTYILETMIPNEVGLSKYTNEEKVKAIGDFFVEIRKDVLNKNPNTKSNLKIEDYKSIGTK
jgi:hypothetical protein